MALLSAFSGDEATDKMANGATYPRAHPLFDSLTGGTTYYPDGLDMNYSHYHGRGVFFFRDTNGVSDDSNWIPHANSRPSIGSGEYFAGFRHWVGIIATGDASNLDVVAIIYDSSGNPSWRFKTQYAGTSDTAADLIVDSWSSGAWVTRATLLNCLVKAGTEVYSNQVSFYTDNATGASANSGEVRVADGNGTQHSATWSSQTVDRKAETAVCFVKIGITGTKGDCEFRSFDSFHNDNATGSVTTWLHDTGPDMPRDWACVFSYYPDEDGTKRDYTKVPVGGSGQGGGRAFCLVDDQEDTETTGPSQLTNHTQNDGIKGVNATDEQEMVFNLPGVDQPDTIHGVCFVVAFVESGSSPTFPTEIGITPVGGSEVVFNSSGVGGTQWRSSSYTGGGYVWFPMDQAAASTNWTWSTSGSGIVGATIRFKGTCSLITAVRMNVLGNYDLATPPGEGGTDQGRMDKNAPCPASLPGKAEAVRRPLLRR